MMNRFLIVLSFSMLLIAAEAQRKDSITQEIRDASLRNTIIEKAGEETNAFDLVIAPELDDISYKDKATKVLRALRNGAVIVRLKTNQKSVDAYRKSGRNSIADRIEADRQKQNERMYQAFQRSFLFCKVFFIYANETNLFLGGNRKIFLNESLQHDTSIIFTDTNFIFCEYGSAESFSKFQNELNVPGVGSIPAKSQKILDTIPTQTSTSPATTSGLFFSDMNLNQLHRPFPFVGGVYMENYDATIRTLSREMEGAYNRLVLNRDFKEKIKSEKKKLKQQLKQLK